MKRLIKTTLLLAALTANAAAVGAHESRWYLSHMNNETCVPLDDIGRDLTRLYYGTGKMRTPEDFVRYVKSLGITLRSAPDVPEGMRAYKGKSPEDAEDTFFVMFNDKAICSAAMSRLEQ